MWYQQTYKSYEHLYQHFLTQGLKSNLTNKQANMHNNVKY